MSEWWAFPRGRDLHRSVDPVEFGKLTCVERYGRAGSWLISGAERHLQPLFEPGSGVVLVRDGVVVLSGPVVRPTPKGDGTATVSGVSDFAELQGRVIMPNPALAPTAQTDVAYFTRNQALETTIVDLVNLNAGPGALTDRRVAGLALAGSQGRGGAGPYSNRFGDLALEVATLAEQAGLAVDILHSEDGAGNPSLQFVVTVAQDVSADVRFGEEGAFVSGRVLPDWEYTLERPTVTRAIGGAQGTGTGRKVLQVVDSAAELLWGTRIEQFVDVTNTNEDAEILRTLQKKIDEGSTKVDARFTLAPGAEAAYPEQWRAGHVVGVSFGGVVLTERVREVTTEVTGGSETVRAVVSSDPDASMYQDLTTAAVVQALRRTDSLERNR